MRHYKVIALSVGGRANKIFSAGDTVTEENFIPGRAEELVRQGFLKPIEETSEPVKEIPSDEIETTVSEPSEDETQQEVPSILDTIKENLSEGNKEEKEGINSKTRKEFIKELTELGIPFEPTASKKELYELWLSRGNY